MESMELDPSAANTEAVLPSVANVPPEIWKIVGEQVRPHDFENCRMWFVLFVEHE
jgi:hypothetical protein